MVSILDRVRRSNDPAPVDPEPDTFEEMTLQEHLEELRSRLMYSAVRSSSGSSLGSRHDAAASPDGANVPTWTVTAISPTESFTVFMKVALYVGIGLSMPVIIYQIIRFLSPGLTRRERQYVFRAIPFVTGMFILGVLFAFFIVIPRALRFLHGFGGDVFKADFRANEVISFYMTLILWVGIVFELPIVMYLLAKLGVVTTRMLGSMRKYALIVIMIAAAIITPTPDPFNMFMVAAPMYALYELGIF